jgi:nucleotide-binding universal stress UspA family protein
MFGKAIVGVDGGPASRDAVAVARVLLTADAHLVLANVHVLTPVRGASGAYGVAETGESLQLLEQERAAAGVEAELLTVTASSAGRGLHYLAEAHDADLLCVGSNSRSFAGRVFIGDATRAALIGAPCAVAVAPLGYAHETGGIKRVGVGYDGSPESEAALAFARELAARDGAALVAMTVVELPPYAGFVPGRAEEEERLVKQSTEELAALAGVEGEVAVGLAGEELAAFGGRVDLLVVGSRGYGPIRRLMLGSTATHLAGNARCPLVVLPRVDDAAGS